MLQIFTGGLITGLLQVVLTTSYAALVYGGKLSPYVDRGIGYALAGALIIAAIVTLFSSLPGSVGSNQDVSVAIFNLISISIVAGMPSDSPPEAVFYTVVTAIALTVLLTGLFFFSLGTFRLGGLVRYLPYPVVGGFLAGSGWLLFKGGFFLMNGDFTYTELFVPAYTCRWLPGLILAAVMFITIRRYQNSYVLPGLILGGTLLFYCASWLLGCSPAELREQGWLLGPFQEEALWRPLTLEQIGMADWNVIAGQSANITAVLIVSSLSLLLNASSLELVAKHDINLNSELRSTGIANMISGLSPGFVGFVQISLTVLNLKMHVRSRLAGLIGVFIIGLTLSFGASIITYFPKVIMGAVLMYLGLIFLVEWTYESWSALPAIDIFIIWMILFVIAVFGFLQGVAVGFMAAVIMFAISCSRTEVVRHELTGKSCQSQVTRLLEHRQFLDQEGEKIFILQLQGFIFFGTVNRLFNQIRIRLKEKNRHKPHFVVLDLHRAANLDSTGMLSFKKLKDLTADSNIYIIITAPSIKIRRQLEKGGLPSSNPLIRYFPSLDAGIEWCENMILTKSGIQLDAPPSSLEEQLKSILPEADCLPQLFDYLERNEIAAGVKIIRQGEAPEDLFFIESGKITIQIDQSKGPPLRSETISSGSTVGEIGFYLGKNRSESVITDKDSVIYRLSAKNLKILEKENPATASTLHQIVIHLLAERVTHLMRAVNALQK